MNLRSLIAAVATGIALGLGLWVGLLGFGAGSDAKAQEAQELNPTEGEYVVQPGDTLWDICAAIVGKGELWPQVWALNHELTNPNWIYPGDIIHFYPRDLPLPTSDGGMLASREMQEEPEPYEEEESQRPTVEVIQTRPVRIRGKDEVPRRAFTGMFVTTDELQESGTLTNAVEDKILLSVDDRVYITFPSDEKMPSVGDRFMLYRTLKSIYHPLTNAHWGYMTQVTGYASIEAVQGEVTRAKVDRAFFEVERGHLVTPLVHTQTRKVTPAQLGNRPVRGVVLAIQGAEARVAGTEQVVFVDKGKADGFDSGARLRVFTRGDPLTGDDEGLPRVEIAKLLVLEAKEKASTCLVIDARREIQPGDPVMGLVR